MTTLRQLGLISATALVMANMIGTGVFTTSGFLMADLESPKWVIVAWLVGGLIALLGALSYGSLARAIPESGGEYLFLSRTLHPAAGYVAGWISLLAGFSAPIAMAAFGFGEYVSGWLPQIPVKVTGSALLLLFAVVHALHVRRGAWFQNLAVAMKLVLLGAFAVMAARHLPQTANEGQVPLRAGAFAVSLVWISFSYSGWNAAVYVASEVISPERNLVRALALGTGVVTAVYVVTNALFVLGVPPEAIAGKVAVAQIAAEALGGAGLSRLVTVIVLFALATSVSAMMMAGPRVYARMSADGFLPAWLRHGAGPPRAGMALQLVLALVFLWTNTFEALLSYIGFTLSASTALTVCGLIRLKRRSPDLAVIGWPIVPSLFLVFVSWSLIFSFGRLGWAGLWGIGTMAIGWLIWRIQTARFPRL